MILFPCISTLFTVNLDSDIRTGDRAQGAPRAFPPLFLETDRAVTPGIVFLGGDDQTFFTCMDAEMAFLAQFPVDNDMSFQIFRLLYNEFPSVLLMARDPGSHHPTSITGKNN
jgi:hypothetical protein